MVLRGVNCHSPLKHYMMFHGGCESGGNYGSIFNTTYNINCGGHGGFWGGVGYGLGNMLGGFLGNMFGGGMFGMGNMFGMGGLFGGGMSMSWMNFWGGGGGGISSSSTSDSSSCKCGCKHNDKKTEKDKETPKAECKDADREKLANYAKTVPAALNDANLRLSDLKKLYDQVKADRTASEKDENHKETDLQEYDNLLKALQDKATAKGWGNLGDKSPVGLDEDPADANGTRTNNGDPSGTVPDNNSNVNKKAIEDAENFSDLPDYDKLTTDDDKNAYADKCKYFASKMDPEDLRAFLKKLPDEVRVKVKASFYKEGLTNATKDDLTADNLKKLIAVIDDSGKVGNFENVKVGSAVQNGDIWTIKMVKANNKERKISYVQVSIEDGEIIFHGDKTTQHYVLQKDNDGNLHLMQYKYHDGYGDADVSDK